MARSFPKPLRYPGMTANTTELRFFAATPAPSSVIDVFKLLGKGDVAVVLEAMENNINKCIIVTIMISKGEDGFWATVGKEALSASASEYVDILKRPGTWYKL